MRSMRSAEFLLLNPLRGVADDELACRALLVAAAYRVHNGARHGPPLQGQEAPREPSPTASGRLPCGIHGRCGSWTLAGRPAAVPEPLRRLLVVLVSRRLSRKLLLLYRCRRFLSCLRFALCV